MTKKPYFRLLILAFVLMGAALVLGASTTNLVNEEAECPANKEKCDDNKTKGADMMPWESVTRHLISSVN
ncbi:MAG: hypothetical protein SFU21_08845 [Flavihumibacter sp.]|nr:hypothetical protein [Flavihumibacter sp.]